ncbi:MAG: SBBP repeat-containing protein [Deferribacteres bacterium]|nr:SBBP repeat-containing protein [Deferribacteres bacterium]
MRHRNFYLRERKSIIALLFGYIFLFLAIAAHAQDLIWAKQAGGVDLDLGSNIAVDADGNCYVVGVFEGLATFGSGDNETRLTSTGLSSIFIAKYSAEASLLWAKNTGVGNAAEAWSEIAVDGSGAIYLTSSFFDTMTLGAGEANETTISSAGSEDIFIAKYTTDGILLWAKQAIGVERNRSTEIGIDSLGNSYISGFISGAATFGAGEANEKTLTAEGASDVFIAKYAANGELVWARQAGGEGFTSGQGIAVDNSGNSFVTGWLGTRTTFGIGESNETTISTVSIDIFLAKYDPNGAFLWVTQSNSNSNVSASRVALDAAGNSYVAGTFEGSATLGSGEANETVLTPAGFSDIFIAKYDNTSQLVWAKTAGGRQYDISYGLAVDASGNSYLTGAFQGAATLGRGEANQAILLSAGNSDILVASFNSDGMLLGAERAGGSQYDAGGGTAIGPSGDVYATGRFHESAAFGETESNETILNSFGVTDIFLAKYATAISTNVGEKSSPADHFQMEQNYPNPFNPQTTIRFALQGASPVRLAVYDLAGRLLEILLDEVKPAGWNEVVFDAGSLPSGVYFYRLQTASFQQTGKMALVR